MDENPSIKEITHISDSNLLETLKSSGATLASLINPQLETYKNSNSRYELNSGVVSLYYFGVHHTYDICDSQLQEISDSFDQFAHGKDTSHLVVLIEGFVPNLTANIEFDISKNGERAFTTGLAKSMGVRAECIEPDRKEEVKILLEQFTPEEIEYYYFLRSVRDFFRKGNIHGEKTFDQYASEVLKDHKNMFGSLEGFSNFDFSFDNIKNIHQAITDQLFDEHHMLSVNPRAHQTITNDVAHACSSFRDFYHVRNIEKFLSEGNSVFVVCGSDHAVIQKPALEKMFEV